MSDTQQFKLPDVGEGLTEAEIVAWHVSVGDKVEVNDTLVDIETAKSIVELPSPFGGFVHQLLVEPGTTVPVGTPLIIIGETQAASGGTPDPVSTAAGQVVEADPAAPATERAPSAEPPVTAEEEKPQVLVGPGPKEAAARQRRLGARRAVAPPRAEGPVAGPLAASVGAAEPAAPARGEASDTAGRSSTNPARATPPVRFLAKQLGVDIDELALSVGGVITREHVAQAATTPALDQAGTATHGADISFSTPRVDVRPAEGERETRIPVKGVRKVTAAAMAQSAFTAPHVTEWLTVDMTRTMELVRRLKADPAWAEVRMNPLVMVAKAYLLALRCFPEINASWDEDRQEIVVKHYINLGIAAATPRGLLVPNIKDAHLMDIRGLAEALADLVAVARSGKTQPADMANGTVTITNIGALGVDAGTPILNPGESAILAFGAVRTQPWVVNDRIEIRDVTTLAMSFDHRLVDGALGSNVLARTGEILTDPASALLYG